MDNAQNYCDITVQCLNSEEIMIYNGGVRMYKKHFYCTCLDPSHCIHVLFDTSYVTMFLPITIEHVQKDINYILKTIRSYSKYTNLVEKIYNITNDTFNILYRLKEIIFDDMNISFNTILTDKDSIELKEILNELNIKFITVNIDEYLIRYLEPVKKSNIKKYIPFFKKIEYILNGTCDGYLYLYINKETNKLEYWGLY